VIRIMSELPPRVLGFEACGKVTAQDYETILMPEVNRAVAEGQQLRLLYYLGPEFKGFSVGAMLEDTRLGIGHIKQWEKIAIVSDLEWVRHSASLFGGLIASSIRVFPNAELDTACAWVDS